MTNTPSLFPDFDTTEPDPRHLARASDPETSHEAAQAIVASVGELQRWAAECVAKSPGKTARELAAIYCPQDPKRIDRRLGECEKLGMVRRGEVRKCNRSGRSAATWWPVAKH